MKDSASSAHQGRIAFVDGMRGFAALFVVVYHLSGALRESLSQVLPGTVMTAFSYGFVGVPIFFVISGLVISTSLNRAIDRRFAGLFILRRSLRLDPTYWAAIAIALSTEALKSWVLNAPLVLPDWKEIALHLVYLQDLAQVKEPISVVYWTLCLEVQFYLFFMLSKWVSEKVAKLLLYSPILIFLVVQGSVGVWSLAIDFDIVENPYPGVFVNYWHYFFAGVLFSYSVKGELPARIGLGLYCVLTVAMSLMTEVRAYPMAGLITLLAFGMAYRWRAFAGLLEARWVLFLGLISYSLYLIHPDIGWKFISVAKLALGQDLPGSLSVIVFFLAIIVSVIAAYTLYLLVEKPSLVLVTSLKRYGIRGIFVWTNRAKATIDAGRL